MRQQKERLDSRGTTWFFTRPRAIHGLTGIPARPMLSCGSSCTSNRTDHGAARPALSISPSRAASAPIHRTGKRLLRMSVPSPACPFPMASFQHQPPAKRFWLTLPISCTWCSTGLSRISLMFPWPGRTETGLRHPGEITFTLRMLRRPSIQALQWFLSSGKAHASQQCCRVVRMKSGISLRGWD